MTQRLKRLGQFAGLVLSVWMTVPAISIAADLVVAMPNWPSGQVTANIIKTTLEANMHVSVDVEEMGTMTAFAGLASGEVDVHPEVWLPNLNSLVEKYGDKVQLADFGVAAWQGICTTRQTVDKTGIHAVADLLDPKKTAAFDTDGDGQGEIWIGAETWSSTVIERIRANSYGYAKTMRLLEMPEEMGMAAVDAAEATDKPIIFACYSPHVVFKLHDIVKLEEPAHDASKWHVILPADDPDWLAKSNAPVAWDTARFHIAYSKALATSKPEVTRFLESIDFTPDEITEMSYAVEVDRQPPADYAKAWVAKNADRVEKWLKGTAK
ncbi:glycine betaine ABC transporter substrate-binding protein [Phyllobacterium zundukense]|jgi:glycine betaine/proline transport system substrate-binding protein|uniref:Amino acid-binding protein n=1 Tax=Phyllobacterium zundukense TaxID=1867719 RepID=A0ACD4CU11_9HYPH|nr:glycine betaine ABC transporter substrate-binding protein [Phyllobacterium zundukense]UXN57056.1 amino acid-binding protein [Phyllobacterium zundukense]